MTSYFYKLLESPFVRFIKNQFFRIDTTLIVMIGLLILLIFSLIMSASNYYDSYINIDNTRHQLSQKAIPAIDHLFESVRSSAVHFEQDWNKDTSNAKTNQFLISTLESLNKKFAHQPSLFVGIALVSETGKIQFVSSIKEAEKSVLAPLIAANSIIHWSDSSESLVIGNIVQTPNSKGANLLSVDYRLHQSSPDIQRKLVILINSNYLFDLVSLEPSNMDKLRFILINNQGKSITNSAYHSNAEELRAFTRSPLLSQDQMLYSVNQLNHPIITNGYQYSIIIPSRHFAYTLLGGVHQKDALQPFYSILYEKLCLLAPISLTFILFCIWYRRRLIRSIIDLTKAAYQLGNEDTNIILPRKIPNKELFDLTKAIMRIQHAQKNIIHTLLSLSTVKEQQDEAIRICEHSDQIKLEILREIRHRTCNFLNAISMTSQMLLCHLRKESNIFMTPEHQEEALIRIDTLVRHIEAFTTDTLENEQFDPCTVMQECIALQRKTLLRGGIHFVYNAQPNIPPLCADKIRFIQAINGLIRRASDFLIGGETITISMEIKEVDYTEFLIITIADNGYGIAEKKRQELFEMHDGRGIERDIDGIELSIASVRKLLILHGGDIELQDEWGKGSVITAKIPYPQSQKQDRGVVDKHLKETLPPNVTLLFKPKENDEE